jgi:hypothetical protein
MVSQAEWLYKEIFVKIGAIVIIASLLPFSAPCQSVSSSHANYRRSEVKQMIRTAHTSEEFDKLASFFEGKEKEFRGKAEEEKKELDRRLEVSYAGSKYPTPVDSARELLQYYKIKANEFGLRANSYRSKEVRQKTFQSIATAK